MATTISSMLLKSTPLLNSLHYPQPSSSSRSQLPPKYTTNFSSLTKRTLTFTELPKTLDFTKLPNTHSVGLIRPKLRRNCSKDGSNLPEEEGNFGKFKVNFVKYVEDVIEGMGVLLELYAKEYTSLFVVFFSVMIMEWVVVKGCSNRMQWLSQNELLKAMAYTVLLLRRYKKKYSWRWFSGFGVFWGEMKVVFGVMCRDYKATFWMVLGVVLFVVMFELGFVAFSLRVKMLFGNEVVRVMVYGGILIPFVYKWLKDRLGGPPSVLMLQLGILDQERVLQRELDTIGEAADTSTSQGLDQIMMERRSYFMKDSLVSFYKKLLITERERYDRDTFMNVDGATLERTSADKANSIENKYTVVTILVLSGGGYVRPSSTLESTLQTMCSIPGEKIEEIDLLWSLHSKGGTTSAEELRRDFPHMKGCGEKKQVLQNWWESLLQNYGLMLPPVVIPSNQSRSRSQGHGFTT